MTAPTIDKLRAYLPCKHITSDGGALALCYVLSGSTAALIRSYDWSGATGAIGFFSPTTSTVALRGIFFHVRSNAISYQAELDENLPAVPQNTDTFYYFIGGANRSSTEAFALLVDDALPELFPAVSSGITGLVLKKASPMLGIGTLAIHYDSGAQTLAAKMGVGAYGTAVDASGNLSDVSLFIDADAGFVRVDCTAASLPVGDADDSWVLTQPKATFTPDIGGYETVLGKTRYRLEVVRNEDSLNNMVDLSVFTDKPAGSSTTVAAGGSLGSGAGTLDVDDASTWPTGGTWIYNSTRNNCRFMFSRSGNAGSFSAMPSGLRGFSYAGWAEGDSLEPMSDVDLGVDGPKYIEPYYVNPGSETTAPSGIGFTHHATLATARSIGTLRPSESCGIWRREVIVAGHTTRESISTDTNYNWS